MRMLLSLMMLRISPKSDIENTWATILYNFSMATMSGQILYMANITRNKKRFKLGPSEVRVLPVCCQVQGNTAIFLTLLRQVTLSKVMVLFQMGGKMWSECSVCNALM
jgi:hypothetical protein